MRTCYSRRGILEGQKLSVLVAPTAMLVLHCCIDIVRNVVRPSQHESAFTRS